MDRIPAWENFTLITHQTLTESRTCHKDCCHPLKSAIALHKKGCDTPTSFTSDLVRHTQWYFEAFRLALRVILGMNNQDKIKAQKSTCRPAPDKFSGFLTYIA